MSRGEVPNMRLTLLFLALLTAFASSRPIGNGDINSMKYSHSRQRSYKKSAKSKRLPKKYLKMEYEKPVLNQWPINYKSWEKEYKKYFQKHYGDSTLTFKPSMIVMHYTVIPTAHATHGAFQRNHVSVQLMVDKQGKIHQLMPLDRKCTGAYGVNHKALSIEMVARTETGLLSRPKQVFASFCLVKYLMAKYKIKRRNVVAHYEVGEGKKRVPQYLDLHDKVYPDRYPPSSRRTDPGVTYMTWLRAYLKANKPTKKDLR